MNKIETVMKLFGEFKNEEEKEKLKTVLAMVFPNEKELPDDEVLILEFEKAQRMLGLSEKSIKQYLFEISIFRKYFGGPLTDATTPDIRSYLWIYKETRSISNVTLENKMRYLSAFYEWLLKEKYVESNPVKGVGRIIQPVRLKKAFSKEELEDLRNCCTQVRERAIIEFFYSTGVRVSECASVRLSDINFEKGEARIIGKGNKERLVYMSGTAKGFILNYLEDRDKTSNEPLFINCKTRQPLTTRFIESLLRDLGKKAGIEKVHPHKFRRTFATDLWNGGAPIETIKVLMGHVNIQTTLRYIDMDSSKIKEVYDKVLENGQKNIVHVLLH